MYVQARQNINHDQFFTTQVFHAKIVKKNAPSHRMTFFKHANKSQSIRRAATILLILFKNNLTCLHEQLRCILQVQFGGCKNHEKYARTTSPSNFQLQCVCYPVQRSRLVKLELVVGWIIKSIYFTGNYTVYKIICSKYRSVDSKYVTKHTHQRFEK